MDRSSTEGFEEIENRKKRIANLIAQGMKKAVSIAGSECGIQSESFQQRELVVV
jgi:hypothetical protein